MIFLLKNIVRKEDKVGTKDISGDGDGRDDQIGCEKVTTRKDSRKTVTKLSSPVATCIAFRFERLFPWDEIAFMCRKHRDDVGNDNKGREDQSRCDVCKS